MLDELAADEKLQDTAAALRARLRKITTPSEILYGNGMEANRDFTWYKITHPTGTVQVNKGEVPQ